MPTLQAAGGRSKWATLDSGGKTVSLEKPHKRIGWLIGLGMTLAATNLLGCQASHCGETSIRTARLNLPSGFEPATHAPKQYRSIKKYDPDYEKHPSRWRRKLRARYA